MSELHVGASLPHWRHRVTLAESIGWSEALRDPNPIHFDSHAVARLGLGDRPISPGPASIAYLVNMLTSTFARGEITALNARMIGFVFVGDEVEVSGRVTAIEGATRGIRAHCSLVIHAGPDRLPAVTAEAIVGIPEESPHRCGTANALEADNEASRDG
jgi:acyl dehydratase